MNAQTPGSDPVYKRLYAFPEMVADLLRSLFPDNALGADYETLRRLPAEYVTTVPSDPRPTLAAPAAAAHLVLPAALRSPPL